MRKYKVLAPWRVVMALGLVALAAVSSLAQQDETVLQRMKKDITFLASDQCEGRGIDTKGIHVAADYIAGELKKAGLRPGGKAGSWFQPFVVNEKATVEGVNTITLKGPIGQTIELQGDKDFKVLPLGGSGVVDAPIVFAGYGVTVPGINYDDFKGADVKGKIVVVLRRVPRWDNDFVAFGGEREKYAGLESKFANCEANQPAAIILVNDRSEIAKGDQFMATTNLKRSGVPLVQMRRGVLDMMLVTGNGTPLIDLEKDIDRDLKPQTGLIKNWTASLTSNVKVAGIECKNVIGVLEGSGPLANETVIVGAHYDHLGFGGQGSLAKAKDKNKKQIHPGADDNASGTTSVLDLARRFGAMKDRQGRRLVFMLFSGEERGLLGSKHYVKEPLLPLASTVAMVNLDMVGRLKEGQPPELIAEGFDSGKGMQQVLDKLNGEFGFKFTRDPEIYPRSDQYSFYNKKIPGMFFFTGLHNEYHRPTDTADKINMAGMVMVAALAEKLIAHLAATPERPEYTPRPAVAKKAKAQKGDEKKDDKKDAKDGKKAGDTAKDAQKKDEEPPPLPLLRMQPDYEDETNKGMLIDNVIDGGPAFRAGIKAGDRITAINGVPTPNLDEYMTVLRRHKAGVPLELTIDRDGKQMKLKVTPE